MALHRMPSRKRKRLIAGMVATLLMVGGAIGVTTASAEGDSTEGGFTDTSFDRRDRDRSPDRPPGDLGAPPDEDLYVDITTIQPNVEEPELSASPGTFVSECGRNENGHNNSDNFIVAPGVQNGAQHTHDYVGNLSTDANSDDRSLAASGTTCRFGDKSTYYWPVLRRLGVEGADQNQPGGGLDGNVGEILVAEEVVLEFRGNAREDVRPMPPFLRAVTGDAKAVTNGDENANAKWTCTGFEDRVTTKYPLCPQGSNLVRILDFPSCSDGRTDSDNHRDHLEFPNRNGGCPRGTAAVPQLRMTLTYDVPAEVQAFALDSFPEEEHDPITDHGDFENLLPRELMFFAVACINSGRNC